MLSGTAMTVILILLAIAACAAVLYQMAGKKPRIEPLDPHSVAPVPTRGMTSAEEEEEACLLWENIIPAALERIYAERAVSTGERRMSAAHEEPSETAKVAMGGLISSFQKISTLHSSLLHLNSPSISLEEAAVTVTRDPVLSSHVLKAANSPVFGMTQGVRSIHTAVNILGIDNLKSLLVFQAMPHTLYSTALQRGMFQEVWRHMNVTAIIASFMGRALQHPDSGMLYTAGLMHDIGKLVLIPMIGKGRCQTYPPTLEEEYELLSATHLQAAQIMAARDGSAPGPLWELILWHHLPALATAHPPLAAETSRSLTVLFLANQLAKLITADGSLEEGRMDMLDVFDSGYPAAISREEATTLLLSRDLMRDILVSARLVQATLN